MRHYPLGLDAPRSPAVVVGISKLMAYRYRQWTTGCWCPLVRAWTAQLRAAGLVSSL